MEATSSASSGGDSNGSTSQGLLEKVLSSSATGTDLQNVARVRSDELFTVGGNEVNHFGVYVPSFSICTRFRRFDVERQTFSTNRNMGYEFFRVLRSSHRMCDVSNLMLSTCSVLGKPHSAVTKRPRGK